MNLVEPSPLKPGDELDGLLRTFFRSQIPSPWPAPPPTHFRIVPAAPRTPSRRSLRRSRWALAASVALLLLGSLLLPGRLTPNIQSGSEFNGRRDARDIIGEQMKIEQEMKKFQEKHNMGRDVKDGGQINALDDSDLSSAK